MIEEKLNEMKAVLETACEDYAKFEKKGNAAAGTRVRVGMQTLKKMAQEVRIMVSDTKGKRQSEKAE